MFRSRVAWRSLVGCAACVAATAVLSSTLRAEEGPAALEPLAGAAAEATATDQTPAAALEVQRALGGPLANQFPQLQSQPAGKPWWKQFGGSLDVNTPPGASWGQAAAWPTWWTPAAPAVVPAVAHIPFALPSHPQIAALRGTAAELEATANRLEEIDLYHQADAIRELAQRLRADARARLARIRAELREPRAVQEPAPGPSADPPEARLGDEPLSRNDDVIVPQLLGGGGTPSAVEWLRPELREKPASAASARDADQADSDGQAGERSVLLGPAPE